MDESRTPRDHKTPSAKRGEIRNFREDSFKSSRSRISGRPKKQSNRISKELLAEFENFKLMTERPKPAEHAN